MLYIGKWIYTNLLGDCKGGNRMSEEQVNEQEKVIGRAKEGDMVQVKKGNSVGKKGKVVVARENSVIIEVGINPNTGEPVKTVVNHKNYKIIK